MVTENKTQNQLNTEWQQSVDSVMRNIENMMRDALDQISVKSENILYANHFDADTSGRVFTLESDFPRTDCIDLYIPALNTADDRVVIEGITPRLAHSIINELTAYLNQREAA